MTGDNESHDLASLRRAFASGPAVAPAPETCPSPETLWSALHGELSATEIRQVVNHTASCSACAEDWRLAMAMESGLEEEEEEHEAAPAPARSARVVRRWLATVRERWTPATQPVPAHPWAVAAPSPWAARARIAATTTAALLLVALGIEIGLHREGPPTYRGSDTVRSLIADGETLPRKKCRLAWTGPDDATYSVAVRNMAGDTLFKQRDLRENGDEKTYVVPEAELSSVRSGTRLEWHVTASRPPGKDVSSPPGIFILE